MSEHGEVRNMCTGMVIRVTKKKNTKRSNSKSNEHNTSTSKLKEHQPVPK